LASALYRKKFLIGGITLLAFAVAMVGVNMVKPRYTAQSKVLIENRDNPFTRLSNETRGEASIDQDGVQSQVQLIMSRDLARDVIQKLGLLGNPEFDPMKRGLGPVKQFLVMLGLARNPTQFSPEDRVLENYNHELLVYPVRGSRVIAIEFSSQNPELAANGANTIANSYLDALENQKKDVSLNASKWLSAAIEPLRQKVAAAEAKVEAYKASSGLYVGANNISIATQQLSELNTQLSGARSQQSDLEARAGVIRNAIKSGRIYDVSEIANNEIVRRLIENRANLHTQIAQESRTLLPGHPRMKELTAQLAGLDTQIKAAAERTARTLENDARVAGARVASLSETIDQQKQRVSAANESEVQLRALEREAKSLRDQLESYLIRNNEAAARNVDKAAPPDARIISRAIEPDTPVFPKKLPIMLIAAISGLLLSAAIVLAREIISGRAYVAVEPPVAPVSPSPAPIPEPVPTAGPAGSEPAPDVATAGDESLPVPEEAAAVPVAVAESVPPPAQVSLGGEVAYKRAVQAIVTEVRGVKPADRGAIVLVTAPAMGAGASSIAVNLGRALVRGGRCVLAEFDKQRPSLRRLVAAVDPRGMADVIAGSAGIGEAIHRDRGSRLHIIPLGHDVHAAAFGDHAETVLRTLDALSETYDFVVCDMGLVGDIDADIFQRADAVLLVARGDETEPRTVDAYHLLKDRGAETVSVILTPARPDSSEAANDARGLSRPA
jgi:uncharacterized protein involved in exopolysaccharide biosynthesis/Mrp family chromosome partitioning ATPase